MGGVRAERHGLGIHLVDSGALSAEHVRQCVGGVVPGDKQQGVQQLSRGVGAAGFDPDAGALDFPVGFVGDDGGVQREFVESYQRQQCFDGAGGCVRDVLVPTGQDLAGIHVGDDPGRGGPVRDRRRADLLHTGVSRGGGRAGHRADYNCGKECCETEGDYSDEPDHVH